MSLKRLLLACLGMLLLGSAGLIVLHQTVDAPPRSLAQPAGGLPGGLPGGGPPGFAAEEEPMGEPGQYKDLVPALLEALADADGGVRQLAAATLVKIGPDAVQPLVEALKSKDRETRANAAYVLGQLGGPAREALPALAKTLKDEDKEVRRRAAYAIHALVAGSQAAMGMDAFAGEPGAGGPPMRSMMMAGPGGGMAAPGVAGPWDPGLLVPPPAVPGKLPAMPKE